MKQKKNVSVNTVEGTVTNESFLYISSAVMLPSATVKLISGWAMIAHLNPA